MINYYDALIQSINFEVTKINFTEFSIEISTTLRTINEVIMKMNVFFWGWEKVLFLIKGNPNFKRVYLKRREDLDDEDKIKEAWEYELVIYNKVFKGIVKTRPYHNLINEMLSNIYKKYGSDEVDKEAELFYQNKPY